MQTFKKSEPKSHQGSSKLPSPFLLLTGFVLIFFLLSLEFSEKIASLDELWCDHKNENEW